MTDELTRAGRLLAVHGVLKLTRSAAMEPVVRYCWPGKQQTVASPFTVVPTKFTFKPGVLLFLAIFFSLFCLYMNIFIFNKERLPQQK